MLVSVIVPTHNRSGQLVRALDSVLAQTHPDLEVIVVDDGSTDDTRDVVARRYGTDRRVVYVSQEQAGVARARNTGLEHGHGELVAFLDSDDVWRPWKLALQLDCLRRAPAAGMIWTNMEVVDSSHNVIPGSSLADILSAYRRFDLSEIFDETIALAGVTSVAVGPGRNLYVGDIFSPMVVGNFVLPSSALLTRSRLDHVGGFDEGLRVAGEDHDFFLRTCRAGIVAFADVPSVLYQVGLDDQLTHPSKKLYLARNYVHTMEGAIARDADRIDLSPAVLRDARASAYAWIGLAYLEAGHAREARRHMRRALGLRPTDTHTLVLAAVALLPGPLRELILTRLRGLKALLRGDRS